MYPPCLRTLGSGSNTVSRPAGLARSTSSSSAWGGHSYFTIIRSDTHIHLTFEKDGWGFCENLASFTLRFKADAGYDHTVFWPERVMQDFPVLTLRACLQMVDRYIANGRNKRRKRS